MDDHNYNKCAIETNYLTIFQSDNQLLVKFKPQSTAIISPEKINLTIEAPYTDVSLYLPANGVCMGQINVKSYKCSLFRDYGPLDWCCYLCENSFFSNFGDKKIRYEIKKRLSILSFSDEEQEVLLNKIFLKPQLLQDAIDLCPIVKIQSKFQGQNLENLLSALDKLNINSEEQLNLFTSMQNENYAKLKRLHRLCKEIRLNEEETEIFIKGIVTQELGLNLKDIERIIKPSPFHLNLFSKNSNNEILKSALQKFGIKTIEQINALRISYSLQSPLDTIAGTCGLNKAETRALKRFILPQEYEFTNEELALLLSEEELDEKFLKDKFSEHEINELSNVFRRLGYTSVTEINVLKSPGTNLEDRLKGLHLTREQVNLFTLAIQPKKFELSPEEKSYLMKLKNQKGDDGEKNEQLRSLFILLFEKGLRKQHLKYIKENIIECYDPEEQKKQFVNSIQDKIIMDEGLISFGEAIDPDLLNKKLTSSEVDAFWEEIITPHCTSEELMALGGKKIPEFLLAKFENDERKVDNLKNALRKLRYNQKTIDDLRNKYAAGLTQYQMHVLTESMSCLISDDKKILGLPFQNCKELLDALWAPQEIYNELGKFEEADDCVPWGTFIELLEKHNVFSKFGNFGTYLIVFFKNLKEIPFVKEITIQTNSRFVMDPYEIGMDVNCEKFLAQ